MADITEYVYRYSEEKKMVLNLNLHMQGMRLL